MMQDDEMKKNINMYKNKDALKHLTKQELEELNDELDLEDLMDDMNIGGDDQEEVNEPVEENDAIDDLIAKMEKVTIDKPEDVKK